MVQKRTLTADYEPLTPAMVDDHKVWEICKPHPREVDTKYRPKQMLVNVKREGTEPKSWYVNDTSVNGLIDKFGDKEVEWVGKSVTLKTKPIEVEGRETKAIFLQSE